MNWLAIETSSAVCSVALDTGAGVIAERTESSAQQHSRTILSMIDQLLHDVACVPAELQGVVWSAGPGSFTGLRIGASVCQALAYACNIPVLPVSSLHVLAQSRVALDRESMVDGQLIAVAVDARMGDAYYAVFRYQQDGLQRVSQDVILPLGTLDGLRRDLGESAMLVGDAWPVLLEASVLESLGYRPVSANAVALLSIARTLPQSLWQRDPAQCSPVYLRGVEGWKKRERHSSSC